jgi:hypothetical protein
MVLLLDFGGSVYKTEVAVGTNMPINISGQKKFKNVPYHKGIVAAALIGIPIVTFGPI